jgi:hypothetical protein
MSSSLAKLVFDASARTKDADGRLHIALSHISKAAVNPYYGAEIPGHDRLGLDPEKVYRMLRHPDELAKGAHTFERLPIMGRHIVVSAAEPQKQNIVGAIGSNVVFNEPFLDADLCFWDAEAIEDIETDSVRELSCAYRYVPVMIPGIWQGQEYDGIMTEIVGNHLAQVEAGRAGSDCLAADEDITMKMSKLGKALYLTLGSMSPKLAADSSLAGLVGKASAKTVNAKELGSKLIAMDSELDPTKLTKLLAATLALDEEKKEGAEDEDPEGAEDDEDEDEDDKKKAAKDEKEAEKAKDKAKDEEKDKAKDKAMDAKLAAMKQGFRDSDEAKRLVREVVGDVVAQDSAEEIYGFALDQMKVGREGVTGVPALRALFNVANSGRSSNPPAVAMDHASAATMFPNASRFSHQ